MMYLLELAILWGLCSALIGVAIFDYLATDDTPLSPVFAFLRDWHDRGGWRSWIASPIGGCAICTSGQIALWSFSIAIPWAWNLSLWLHLLAACSAITFALALIQAHRWLKNRI